MKTWYKLSIIASLLASGMAQADMNRAHLDQISRSESGWQGVSLEAPGFQGDIAGYVTAQNSIRFARFPMVLQAVAEVDKPSLKRINEKIFRDWCANIRFGFKYAKKQGAAYVVNLHVNPLASQGTVVVNGQERAVSEIENQVRISNFIPRLELSADANSIVDTGIEKAEFEQFVQQQLVSQRDAIASTGDAILDLTGWDDVACDLVQGYGKLRIGLNVTYDSALVTRQPVIGGDQIQQVYSSIRPYWKAQRNVLKSYVIAGALLGGAVTVQLRKSPFDFGVDNFIALFSQLFELPSGDLKSLSPSEVAALAMNLDILSRGSSVATPVIQEMVSVKTR